MDTTNRCPGRPTTTDDLHRLAELGRSRGLRLFEPQPGHWFCSSASDPFALHTVTGLSCDCAGFAMHGRCSHHSLLLAHLGWLPPLEPEPEPPCRVCGGLGIIYVADCERAGWPHPPCRACDAAALAVA